MNKWTAFTIIGCAMSFAAILISISISEALSDYADAIKTQNCINCECNKDAK